MVHPLGTLGLSSELRSLCLNHPLLLTQEKYKFTEANSTTPEEQETVVLVASCKLATKNVRPREGIPFTTFEWIDYFLPKLPVDAPCQNLVLCNDAQLPEGYQRIKVLYSHES